MIIHLWTGDYRSYGFTSDLWDGETIPIEVPDDFKGGNVTYNPVAGDWVTDPIPEPDYLADANVQRLDLLSLYRTTTENWNTDLQLGIISDEDKEKLIAWVAWRKAVEAVDISTAPEITWPEIPQVKYVVL